MQNYFAQLGITTHRHTPATQVLVNELPAYLTDHGDPIESIAELNKRLAKEHDVAISTVTLNTWVRIHKAASRIARGEKIPEATPYGISDGLWRQIRTARLPVAETKAPLATSTLEHVPPEHTTAVLNELLAGIRELPAALRELRAFLAAHSGNGHSSNGNGNGNGNGHHDEAPPPEPQQISATPVTVAAGPPARPDGWMVQEQKKTLIERLNLPLRTMGGWRIVYTPLFLKEFEREVHSTFHALVKEHLIYFVQNPRDTRLHRKKVHDVNSRQLHAKYGIKGCDLERVGLGRFRAYLVAEDDLHIYTFSGIYANAHS